jgi:hypothetical protein
LAEDHRQRYGEDLANYGFIFEHCVGVRARFFKSGSVVPLTVLVERNVQEPVHVYTDIRAFSTTIPSKKIAFKFFEDRKFKDTNKPGMRLGLDPTVPMKTLRGRTLINTLKERRIYIHPRFQPIVPNLKELPAYLYDDPLVKSVISECYGTKKLPVLEAYVPAPEQHETFEKINTNARAEVTRQLADFQGEVEFSSDPNKPPKVNYHGKRKGLRDDAATCIAYATVARDNCLVSPNFTIRY